MKKLLVFLCTIFLVLGVIETAGATLITGTPSPLLNPVFGTLIDFDDQATGTAVGEFDYVSLGIASITETEGLGFFGRYAGTQSSPNYVGTGSGGERGTDANMGWDGTILIEFTGLASQVGIGIANNSGGPEYITAYDSGMNLLETYTVPSGLNVYYGINYGAASIKYFEITGDFFSIDDLQHDASIPEPATMLLLGSGLFGLAVFGRKKLFKK